MTIDSDFLLVITSSGLGEGEADLGAKLTDRLEETLLQHINDFNTYAGKFQSLYHDYDVTNDTLAKELKEFVALRQTQRDRVMELHFSMVALTSADEWQKIIDHELSAIETGSLVPATEKEG